MSDNWILTFTGKKFDYEEIESNVLCIEDIAHGLSNNCRFNGQCRKFYSVAQHSILLSQLVSKENRLVALLHDATEAYMPDFPNPLKKYLPEISRLEKRIWFAVAKTFGLDEEIPEEVHEFDRRICSTELVELFKDFHLAKSLSIYKPIDKLFIKPWTPEKAKKAFLNTYYILGNV